MRSMAVVPTAPSRRQLYSLTRLVLARHSAFALSLLNY